MSDNLEHMYYVGKKPWHALGVEDDENIGLEEGFEKSGLNWSVSKETIYLNDGTEVPENFAIVRSSDRSVLGSVGSRYNVYQNHEAFKWFEPFLDSGLVKFHTAGSLQNGRRVWILAKIN